MPSTHNRRITQQVTAVSHTRATAPSKHPGIAQKITNLDLTRADGRRQRSSSVSHDYLRMVEACEQTRVQHRPHCVASTVIIPHSRLHRNVRLR